MRSKRTEEFNLTVANKFNVYNSLFLNLPYSNIKNIGILIPLLFQSCEKGLQAGKNPSNILNDFFSKHTTYGTEEERIDFMFKVIQYVERQVVLFDSVEDAAFPQLKEMGEYLSIDDFFQLSDDKKNWDQISDKLANFGTRLVFTAHPTQFYPLTVLNIIRKLSQLIKDDEIENIYELLQQLGLTSLINSEKPTPYEEAKNILYFLRYVYYDAIGNWFSQIKSQIRNQDFDNYNLIRLGFWPGGDRDGNPFVTADTTMKVADELRMTLMKCYYNDLKDLQRKLTFKNVYGTMSELLAEYYHAMFDKDLTLDHQLTIEKLEAIKTIITQDYNGLYNTNIQSVIDKMNIFKRHFATLDIRQDHSIHKIVMEAILKKEGLIQDNINEINDTNLIQILLKEQINILETDYEEPIVCETIRNISQLPEIQIKNGEDGCHRYIISNSEDIYAVLFVVALFRWIHKMDHIPFDIIPLFETMKGMANSEKVMNELFNLEFYNKHIEKRSKKQTIMLGFSDGTKDGGYLKANWSIFKTKEKLTRVCDEHKISAIFFDGRGGPPARGGGKSHRFYAAQGKNIANNEIQLTIQGQTITSTFGTQDRFIHNCEQLVTAGLANSFNKGSHEISDSERQVIEELAEISFNKYNELKHHDKFISYLENRSTLKYYDKANIGSRPGKRGNKKELTLNDLRAISFVGSWSQLKQNVPGYYGIGTALKHLEDQGRLQEAKDLFAQVPFFKALILNSMMSLSKCYFELTAYMAEDRDYGEFWNVLFDEYELSKEMVLKISGYHQLMEEEPISKRSIKMREDIVLPLLVIQQHALQQIHKDVSNKVVYENLVTRSLYGNINASRNSA